MGLDARELITILNKQKNLVDELLELATEHLQDIKLGDVSRFSSLNMNKEYVAKQLANLEMQRLVIMDKYSRETGIGIRHYSQLKAYTAKEDFEHIQGLREAIIKQSGRLKAIHQLSRNMLKQSLRFTSRMLEILNSKNSFIYKKSGDLYRTGTRKIVDTNV